MHFRQFLVPLKLALQFDELRKYRSYLSSFICLLFYAFTVMSIKIRSKATKRASKDTQLHHINT